MRRGDVFTVSVRGSAAKPRPCIVIQADEFIRPDRPVLVCPLTSELSEAPFFRITIEPSVENGLRAVSQAMIDGLTAALPRELGKHVGQLDVGDMARVEFGLINILGLQQAAAIASGIGAST